MKGLEIFPGNGKLVSFWKDLWVGNSPLSERFPRLFRASLLPNGSIADMGYFVSNVWKWDIGFRRRLFEWEKAIFQDLLDCINQVKISFDKEDKLVWKEGQNEMFSSRSFYNFCLMQNGFVEVQWAKFLWKGIVPPKVESMVWLAILDRLPTKRFLCSRGFLFSNEDLKCGMCGSYEETASHLFLSCSWAWSIWGAMFSWWEVSWVCPNSLEDMIIQWVGGFHRRGSKKAWEAVFFATMWSIWLGRNRKIFQNVSISIPEIVELIKLRSLAWIHPFAASHPFNTWCWFNFISLWKNA